MGRQIHTNRPMDCLGYEYNKIMSRSGAKILMTSSQVFFCCFSVFFIFPNSPSFFHRILAHFWCVSKRNVSWLCFSWVNVKFRIMSPLYGISTDLNAWFLCNSDAPQKKTSPNICSSHISLGFRVIVIILLQNPLNEIHIFKKCLNF